MSSAHLPHDPGYGEIDAPSGPHHVGGTIDVPVPLSRLIGREAELAEIARLLIDESVRLVTLTGPGGTGKTRLGISAVRSIAHAYYRVHFVPLVSIADPDHVADAIMRHLGLHNGPQLSQVEMLSVALAQGPTLLVLDNFEQLLPAAHLVHLLLSRVQNLQILVTSRTSLGIPGERLVNVPHLELPASGLSAQQILATEAVALFLERVRGFAPDYSLEGQRLSDIVAICDQLDGLPLAIELAAARVRILTPGELRVRLHRKLDILVGAGPGTAVHQQTMRRTIAWSVDLLGEPERMLFVRLAAFGGSFDLASVESLAGPGWPLVLTSLESLVKQNLVVRDPIESSTARYRLLSTIREYACELLAVDSQAEEIGRRFSLVMADSVEDIATRLTGSDQVLWATRMDQESPNIWAALEWFAARGEYEYLLGMIQNLQPWWLLRGQFDVAQPWLDSAVRIAEENPSLPAKDRAGIQIAAGRMAHARGQNDSARTLAEIGLSLARDGADIRIQASALELLGLVSYRVTDYSGALAYFTAALELSSELGDQEGKGWTLHGIATLTMDAGDLRRSEQLFAEAQATFQSSGNVTGEAMAMDNLGVALYAQGDFIRAKDLSEEALVIFRGSGNTRRIAVALDHIGKCARQLGHLDRAWQCHTESLDLRRQFGDPRGLLVWLEAVTALIAVRGHSVAAGRVLGATMALRAAKALPLHGNEAIDHAQTVSVISHQLEREEFFRAISQGEHLELENAIGLAIASMDLAAVSSPPDPVFASLTTRETEILGLLVQRLSDREIADQLQISPRTVGRHLSNAYAKLGVQSRREAADRISSPPTG